jgi:hypothetical protein
MKHPSMNKKWLNINRLLSLALLIIITIILYKSRLYHVIIMIIALLKLQTYFFRDKRIAKTQNEICSIFLFIIGLMLLALAFKNR